MIRKRLAIMVLYDALGEVPDYVNNLLKEISAVVDGLFIVFNGEIQSNYYERLKSYTTRILVRENKGFDVGAYKDAIRILMDDGSWKTYNQVIFLNDSFFGFFYPIEEYLNQAEAAHSVDFWGMTRYPQNKQLKIDAHLQSYFLLINQRMMQSEIFMQFWDSLEYPAVFDDAVKNFEVKFTPFFERKGFSSKAFCEQAGIHYPEYVVNPYNEYIYELVTEWHCPILKIKSFFVTEDGPYKVVDFIQRNGLYDSSVIWNYLQSENAFKRFGESAFPVKRLEDFCRKFAGVYIYGNGEWARKIRSYLEYKNIYLKGNIVSSLEGQPLQKDLFEFKNLEISNDIGIILALNKENTEVVFPKVKEHVSEEQLFVGKFN